MSRPAPQSQPLEAPADYPFPKNDDGHIPWSRVLEQLQRSRNYWLATVRADGRPHVAPLWGIWLDDRLYFEGEPTTRWARNLAANPSVSANLENGCDVVIVEGLAELFTLDPELRLRLIEEWRVKYGMYGPQPDTEQLYRLQPRVVRAWSESMLDGARWKFGDS